MKKFAKIGSLAVVAGLAIVVAVFTTGCFGMFSIPMFENTPEAAQLHGTWSVVRYRSQRGSASSVTVESKGFIQFNANNTWEENNPWHGSTSTRVSGTWKLEDDTLTLTYTTGTGYFWGPIRTIRINDDGDKITVKYEDDGIYTIEYRST